MIKNQKSAPKSASLSASSRLGYILAEEGLSPTSTNLV